MFDVDKYRNRFAGKALRVLDQAIDESIRRGQNYLSLSHVFKALKAEEPFLFNQNLSFFKIAPLLTDKFLEELVVNAPKHRGQGIRIAPEVSWLFRQALKTALARHSKRIELADLVIGLLSGLIDDSPPQSTEHEQRNIKIALKVAGHQRFVLLQL